MLIIFDKDGTLVSNEHGPPGPGDTQVLLPGREEACRYYREAGDTLAIASNQGGVAHGFLTYAQAIVVVAQVAEMIGAEEFRLCPYHARGTVEPYCHDAPCRKPRPGMLLSLMVSLGFDGSSTIFVGDSEEDQGAARAAGIEFHWASEFFEAYT